MFGWRTEALFVMINVDTAAGEDLTQCIVANVLFKPVRIVA
jgi:hypothetical protein